MGIPKIFGMAWAQCTGILDPLRCCHVYKNCIKLDMWQILTGLVLLYTRPSLSLSYVTVTRMLYLWDHLSYPHFTYYKETNRYQQHFVNHSNIKYIATLGLCRPVSITSIINSCIFHMSDDRVVHKFFVLSKKKKKKNISFL